MNTDYLDNGIIYLTCNCCDKLIPISEMNEEDYNKNQGYCNECLKGE